MADAKEQWTTPLPTKSHTSANNNATYHRRSNFENKSNEKTFHNRRREYNSDTRSPNSYIYHASPDDDALESEDRETRNKDDSYGDIYFQGCDLTESTDEEPQEKPNALHYDNSTWIGLVRPLSDRSVVKPNFSNTHHKFFNDRKEPAKQRLRFASPPAQNIEEKCKFCKQHFASRNKLHCHLEAEHVNDPEAQETRKQSHNTSIAEKNTTTIITKCHSSAIGA
ncbi:hypothetical protein K3495_g605 [Podosphaera aphanis]|nr:hypothetical protein K3495_g605 [Podosphaera aphanis]